MIAYLIKYRKFSFESAFLFLKGLKPDVRPNDGFCLQLRRFELGLKE